MTRRPLGELLVELADAAAVLPVPVPAPAPAPAPARDVRITDVVMLLPIEVVMQRSGDGLTLTGDAPRWRWRTAFDRDPGRLTLHLREGIPQ
ncbi:MAG: hypothetical protein ACT4R6_07765 [Gemmatimonadaceae bacterium]